MQSAQSCRGQENYEKYCPQVFHTGNWLKWLKIKVLHQVIHIIHMNECELCGLLLLRKERMFWSVIIKIFICRKKIKNLLTFENSKIVLKCINN